MTTARLGRLDRHRRALQLSLGVIWLLDAALQFQPYMFTPAFAHEILAPAGTGNPGWISHPVHWAAAIAAHHPVPVNAAFAIVQLLIALGLFTPATVRVALAGSVVWALGVWWLGEGLGGLLVATQSPIAASPGAALLYALIAILIWPTTTPPHSQPHGPSSVAEASPLRPLCARLAWIIVWLGFAAESLQAANRAPSSLSDMVAGMADGEPSWLRTVDRHSADALAHHGAELSIVLAAAFLVIAWSVLATPRIARGVLVAAVALAALIWVVGQNLGEIATGQATDPNTGPLLVLLAAVYWPVAASTSRDAERSRRPQRTFAPAR